MLTVTAWATRTLGLLVMIMLLGTMLSGPNAVAASGPAETITASPQWEWPIGPPFRIVRPFIAPPTPYASGHRGIDIGGRVGIEVRAPASGIVHYAGWVVDRPVLSIRHGDGLISSFEPVASSLVAGEPVARGQAIGTLEAGHCAAACLHLGVRRHGEYVSPLLYLGGIERSVLLPTRWIEE
ncbi:MAG: M23 family metallopeptidase [Cryobacterium sp.]|nr:M23 family metallopeptidase [Cryobacterium sp.]